MIWQKSDYPVIHELVVIWPTKKKRKISFKYDKEQILKKKLLKKIFKERSVKF